MTTFCSSIFCVFLLGFVLFFSKKLLCLLFLEGAMVCCVFNFNFCNNNVIPTTLLVLSVFMVLDSVYSLSVYTMSSRENVSDFLNF